MEIEDLSSSDRVIRTVDKLSNTLVEFAQDLIRTPSVNPPGDESDVAAILRSFLEDAGLEVQTYEAAPKRVNLEARLKGLGGGPTLLFNGHTDVVPISDISRWTVEPFSGEIKEGRIYGRGAADMKGALASIATAIRAIVDSGISLKGNVLFHAVADEEAGSNYGTRFLVREGLVKADMGIVAEGSVFLSKIAMRPAVRGSCWVKLKTLGKAAHASNPAKGVNAVLKMAKIILALEGLQLAHKPHKYLPAPTISVGTVISGGVKTNIIPDLCEADLDIRIVPGMTSAQVLEGLRGILERLMLDDPSLVAEMELIGESEPAEISEDALILTIAKDATKLAVGYEPELRGGWGTNDSQFLINKVGIPTLCGFGPGDNESGNAHGADENVEIQMLVNFAKIYALTILRACEGSER